MFKLWRLPVLIFFLLPSALYCFPKVTAQAYLLMNIENGRVLYSRSSDKPLYPASLTKVATALYILDRKASMISDLAKVTQDSIGVVSLKEKVQSGYSLPAYWMERGGTHISLHAGETFTIEDLLGAMLIASANDAANVVAAHVSGSVPKFMDELNEYLKSIGCTQTHFMNPHGLHHPDHVTTARDLAIITQRAMRIPAFRNWVCQPVYHRKKTSFHKAASYPQTNRLLRAGKYYYPAATGVKTGYHSLTKYCLISAAEKKGRNLLLVQMGSKSMEDRFREAKELFEYAFAEDLERKTVLRKGKLQAAHFLGKGQKPLYAELREDVSVQQYPSEQVPLEGVIYWSELELPVEKGMVVGQVKVREKESKKVIADAPIFALNQIDEGLWETILNLLPF